MLKTSEVCWNEEFEFPVAARSVVNTFSGFPCVLFAIAVGVKRFHDGLDVEICTLNWMGAPLGPDRSRTLCVQHARNGLGNS